MADSTIQGLSAVDTLESNDLFPMWDSSASQKQTKKATIKQLMSFLIPVGTILPYAGTTAPDGFLICDGTDYANASYVNLYPILKDLPGCVSSREGYFKVPDLRNRFLQGSDENLGNEIEAGVPDIYGMVRTTDMGLYPNVYGEGAFFQDGNTTKVDYDGDGSGNVPKTQFLASRGERKLDGTLKTDMDYKVYGKSETVQPPAFTVNYIIKY